MPRLTPSATFRLMLCATLALVGLACGADGAGRTPTAPGPLPGPPAATADVSGTWAGTMTVVWDPIDGGGSCAQPATATLEQRGAVVTGRFADRGCGAGENLYRFDGHFDGSVLNGQFVFPTFTWPASGQLVGDQLKVSAVNVSWDLRR